MVSSLGSPEVMGGRNNWPTSAGAWLLAAALPVLGRWEGMAVRLLSLVARVICKAELSPREAALLSWPLK